MNAAIQDAAVEAALARAAVYAVLSTGFAYPDDESVRTLRTLLELALEEAAPRFPQIAGPLTTTAQAAAAADADSAAGRHTRLFAGSVRCSPHETEYESDPFAKARQLADIAGFYRAFGVEVSETHRGLPDFIGTETEFMALLCRKEARARVLANDEHRDVARNAQRAFLEAHLGRWTLVFGVELRRHVERVPEDDLYRALADLLETYVELEVQAFGVRPVPLTRRMTGAAHVEPPACDPRVAGCRPAGDF